MSDDFRLVMEKISGKDLKAFFNQWIFRAGHPKLEVVWQYDTRKKQVLVILEQKQEHVFDFSLDIGFKASAGTQQLEKVKITSRKQEFLITTGQKPTAVILDPNVWLLFDGSIHQKTAKSQDK